MAPPSVHTHTHTHTERERERERTLPTTMSVLETPFDIHVSSVYQTHTCMQAAIPTLCVPAKKTHNKGSRTQPILSTLMPRSGIPVICSRATLSCAALIILAGNDGMHMRARKSSNFGLIGPPTAELAALERLKKKSPQAYYNGKNDVSNFSPLFLIGSFSCLQVMITYMRAWISLKISQI